IDSSTGGVDHMEKINEFLIFDILEFDLCLFFLNEITVKHCSEDGRMSCEILIPTTLLTFIFASKVILSFTMNPLIGSISLSQSVKIPPTVFLDCTKFRETLCSSERLKSPDEWRNRIVASLSQLHSFASHSSLQY
ncbi:hypothetical protein PFISCL1PPCAC_21348, partial [Pristionchus fissidentatus]